MSRYWKSVVFCGLLFVTLQLIGLQYPTAEYAMVRARWLIWGLGMGWRYWKVPTFRRGSQNQTVSSGVEGAHEGIAADESGSREPEKLNNAQESAVEFLDYAIDMVESDCSTDAIVATLKAAKEALAESSLSSPPPTKDDSSAPTIPAPLSTQLNTTTEKI